MKWNKSFGMWSSSTHRQDIIVNIVWQFTDDRKTYRWKNSFQSRLIYFIYNPENDSSSSSFHEKLFHSFLPCWETPWLLILLLTFLWTHKKKLIFFSLFLLFAFSLSQNSFVDGDASDMHNSIICMSNDTQTLIHLCEVLVRSILPNGVPDNTFSFSHTKRRNGMDLFMVAHISMSRKG